jgi:hypothetical protein
MSYTPLSIRIRDALYAVIRAQMPAQLTAVGQLPLADTAFVPTHPEMLSGECVGLTYQGAQREIQAHFWIETSYTYELDLFAFGVSLMDLQTRVMYLEYAAMQALYHDRTLGGLLRTLKAGASEPIPVLQSGGHLVDGVIITITCEPAVRQSIPERDAG